MLVACELECEEACLHKRSCHKKADILCVFWLTHIYTSFSFQAAGPLPPSVPFPTLDAASLVQLGTPKYRITLLPPSAQSPHAPLTHSTAAPEHTATAAQVALSPLEQAETVAATTHTASQTAEWAEAVRMAAAFRRVAAVASGCPVDAVGLPSAGDAQSQ